MKVRGGRKLRAEFIPNEIISLNMLSPAVIAFITSVSTGGTTTTAKAFPVENKANGDSINHGLNSSTGLTTSQSYLSLEAYDNSGNQVSGITPTSITNDNIILAFSDITTLFTGVIIIKLTPKAS